MSNRRRSHPPTHPIFDHLAELVGQQVPGGCEDCNAFQTFRVDGSAIATLRIHHDETCPWLKRAGS